MNDPTSHSEHTLRDGSRVRIRPLGPSDAPTLQAGFRALSPESRRRRFLRPKTFLSERELRFLTGCDEGRGIVLGAARIDERGWETEGLALARCIRLAEDRSVAEPSITVLDGAQGLGLGRLMAEQLMRVASANGVKTFRCLLADEHGWLRERIARTYPEAQLTRRGPLLGADFAVPAQAFPSGEDEIPLPRGADRHWNLLRWVAQGKVHPRELSRRGWLVRLREAWGRRANRR